MNVDMAVDIFTKKLTDILDKMAPVKKFQVRTKYAAWLTKKSKDLILERDRAFQIASTSGLDRDWTGYKQLRNLAISQLRKDKLNWQQSKLSHVMRVPTQGDLEKIFWAGLTGHPPAPPPS